MYENNRSSPLHGDNMTAAPSNPNYLDIHHEYYGPPDDEGIRLRSVDVWFATKPSLPEYGLVDPMDKIIEGAQAEVKVAWTISKVGQDAFYIFDRDDIDGLRELLNALERDFERRDMEQLFKLVEEDNAGVDNPDEEA